MATIGAVSNPDQQNITSARRPQPLARQAAVGARRGDDPIDHPHAAAKAALGRPPSVHALGKGQPGTKTRRNKKTDG